MLCHHASHALRWYSRGTKDCSFYGVFDTYEAFRLNISLFLSLFVCLFFLINYSYFLYFSYDYLRITNDTNDVIGTFCGNQTGASVTVTGNYALLTFRTDQIIQKTGFELFFSYGGFPGKFSFLKSRTSNQNKRIWMSGD